MNLQIEYFAGFVRAHDINMGLYYFVDNVSFASLDTSSIGASTRLRTAAEFIVHHSGDIQKQPMKTEALVAHYLQLRAGQAPVGGVIPKNVRLALEALNAAVLGAG